MKSKFSIIIPCYNEEKTVYSVVKKICNSFENELVVVINDGSTDNSLIELNKIENNNLYVINQDENMGKGFAMRNGLDFIKDKSEIVIFTDADEEILTDDLKKVLSEYKDESIDSVFGSRFKMIKLNKIMKMGLHRYFANRFLTIISNLFFGQKITDMETAVKSFKTRYISLMDLKSNGFDIEPELVKEISKQGIKIKEVPISYEPRSIKDGKKISFKDGLITMKYLFRNFNG